MNTFQVSEALQALLRELPQRIALERLDRVWLFSPRDLGGGKESGLVVLSLRPLEENEQEQRQIVTWRYEAEQVRRKLKRTDALAEQGRAPAERIPRLIEGVVARLRDEAETPVTETIAGEVERWDALLQALGVNPVDAASE